jgi:arylsulfatase A-like enzyme
MTWVNADLGCYGRQFSTPRIDSLARAGALFTDSLRQFLGVVRPRAWR